LVAPRSPFPSPRSLHLPAPAPVRVRVVGAAAAYSALLGLLIPTLLPLHQGARAGQGVREHLPPRAERRRKVRRRWPRTHRVRPGLRVRTPVVGTDHPGCGCAPN
jgi:hypothetical protein